MGYLVKLIILDVENINIRQNKEERTNRSARNQRNVEKWNEMFIKVRRISASSLEIMSWMLHTDTEGRPWFLTWPNTADLTTQSYSPTFGKNVCARTHI